MSTGARDKEFPVDANTYLNSLGIEVTEPAQPAIGRLALVGEFTVGKARGVILRPKRGGVSDRYLDLLAAHDYAFVVVDGGRYPAVYARDGAALGPVWALPIDTPRHFPSEEILAAWRHLIRSAAGHRGDAAQIGVAQLAACLGDGVSAPERIRPDDDIPIERIGGTKSTVAEPLRTAAGLLAGFRLRPSSPDELARLVVAVSSLLPGRGQFLGLNDIVASLLRIRQLGERRLLVSGGAGAEIGVLFGARGCVLLPSELRFLEPLLKRLLPDVERVFSDFLRSRFSDSFDGVVVVPPLGQLMNGAQIRQFVLAKRGGKARRRVASELLFVEYALAATVEGGLLVIVLPEGVLSSAGHADFRAWLLDHAQLLAVVSLPSGTCFRSTSVKCSVVLLRKRPTTDDYPILMIDTEADDLRRDVEAAKSKVVAFLEQEAAECV